MDFYRDIRYHHKDFKNSFFEDYNHAVNEYKKSFPSKVNVIENAPDPAVREMLVHMEIGCETCLTVLMPKPHCNLGLQELAVKL